jgi:hypothetical protein
MWLWLFSLLQEASHKGRVFEELVTDLSNVVAQQKLHIQVWLELHIQLLFA